MNMQEIHEVVEKFIELESHPKFPVTADITMVNDEGDAIIEVIRLVDSNTKRLIQDIELRNYNTVGQAMDTALEVARHYQNQITGKVLITMSGGCIQSITTTGNIGVAVVDWDDFEAAGAADTAESIRDELRTSGVNWAVDAGEKEYHKALHDTLDLLNDIIDSYRSHH